MTYKESFIKFMEECGVLTFGSFTLKSGRQAPYFINAGNYNTGAQLARLGEFYADCIKENNIAAETLFGPAYKGIPLAATAAASLFNKYGIDLNYAFDRKEAKDHGEGGLIVGKQLKDGEKIVIIEDVMTSGKALREVLPKLKAEANVDVSSMVIQVDRMERGLTSELSAVEEVKRDFGVTVYPIVTILDIIAAAESGLIKGKEYVPAMLEYRAQYGVGLK
ncbi:MAG: orotate phosphoribosyltransferase [Ruminococcaceae bacterium]|nr:orotate phosphoribosyltransferase [Oscillospiraceae bacterium]